MTLYLGFYKMSWFLSNFKYATFQTPGNTVQGWIETRMFASGWWLIYTDPNIMRNGWSCPKIPEKMLLEACQLFWFVEKKNPNKFLASLQASFSWENIDKGFMLHFMLKRLRGNFLFYMHHSTTLTTGKQ